MVSRKQEHGNLKRSQERDRYFMGIAHFFLGNIKKRWAESSKSMKQEVGGKNDINKASSSV